MYSIDTDYNIDNIYLCMYRAYCYLNAQQNLFSQKNINDDLNKIFLFHYDEIVATLKKLAYFSRFYDEENENCFQKKNFNVGILYQGRVKNGEAKELSLREACNKIIHYDHLAFDKNIIFLSGKYKDKEWTASLDIFKFLNALSEVIKIKNIFITTPNGVWSEYSPVHDKVQNYVENGESDFWDKQIAYVMLNLDNNKFYSSSGITTFVDHGHHHYSINFVENFDTNKMQVKLFSDDKVHHSFYCTSSTLIDLKLLNSKKGLNARLPSKLLIIFICTKF